MKYYKTNNRELKIHNINKELKDEIEQARESRISNNLQYNIDHKKELLLKKCSLLSSFVNIVFIDFI